MADEGYPVTSLLYS